MPKQRKTPYDISLLRQLFDYDASTGVLRWKVSRSNRVKASSVAGYLNKRGYREIRIDGVVTYAHLIAFAIHHGRWPKPFCDHKNRNRDDNCASNLRECSWSDNQRNTSISKNNKLGVKGVCKVGKRYRCYIYAGQHHHLGYFDTIEEAKAARDAKEKELFGSFSTV